MPYGSNAKIGLAVQNSWGTAASVNSLFSVPFIDEDITPDRPELIGQNNFGRFDEGAAYPGPENVGGTISGEAQSRVLGLYFKALFGDADTTVSSLSLRTRTWTPRQSDFDVNASGVPMTFHANLDDGGQALQYHNLVLTGLELAATAGEFYTYNANFTGGNVGKVNSVAIDVDDTSRFTWDVTSLQLGGAANTLFSSFNLSINENASAKWNLKTDRNPDRVKRDSKRTIRVSGTLRFDDQTEYDHFISNSAQQLVIHLKGQTEIQSGYYDELTIDIPKFVYLSYPIPLSQGETEVSFDGKADYHAGSGTAIAVTLQNTQANY